jgi:hypothetical protein
MLRVMDGFTIRARITAGTLAIGLIVAAIAGILLSFTTRPSNFSALTWRLWNPQSRALRATRILEPAKIR